MDGSCFRSWCRIFNRSIMKNIESTQTETLFLTVQQVRLLDVFVVAPFCFYVAAQKNLSNPIRIGMVVLGASTLFYNLNNYLKNKKQSND